MNTLFKEIIIDTATPYSERGINDPVIIKTRRTEKITEIVSVLNMQEKRVFKLLFGYYSNIILNEEEIADLFNITKQKVRKIQQNYLRKIMTPERHILIRDLYEINN